MDRDQRATQAGAAGVRGKDVEPLPQFVFATAYDQYAVRAFDVNAVDYLLKPFDRSRVVEAVDRVRGRISGGVAAGGSHVQTESPMSLSLKRCSGCSRIHPQGLCDNLLKDRRYSTGFTAGILRTLRSFLPITFARRTTSKSNVGSMRKRFSITSSPRRTE